MGDELTSGISQRGLSSWKPLGGGEEGAEVGKRKVIGEKGW